MHTRACARFLLHSSTTADTPPRHGDTNDRDHRRASRPQTRTHGRRRAHLPRRRERRDEPPHDHIIELRPNRGAVVASPSPKEARDVFAARRALEREIVPLVVKRATPASLRAIRSAIEAEEAARHGADRTAWIRLGGEFHLLLAALSGNAVLERFMAELVSRCSLIIALYENPGAPMCGNHDHHDLLTLIENGDAEQATRLIEHHLLEIEARLHLGEQDRKVNLAEALGER
jgi:DNA-binding GntR family transcriptional regulator